MSLAACSKDVAIQTSKSEDINFNVVLGKATKATETTTSTLETDGTFYVSSRVGTSTTPYFYDMEFEHSTTGTWTSNPLHYYPTDGSTLNFFAYHPEITSDNWGITPTSGSSKISFSAGNPRINNVTPNADLSKQKDLIIAVANGSKADAGQSKALVFKHILSQITIMAKNTNTNYSYAVSGVRINGVLKTDSFMFPSTATTNEVKEGNHPSQITIAENWSKNTDNNPKKVAYIQSYDYTLSNTTLGSDYQYMTGSQTESFMLLPQALNSLDTSEKDAYKTDDSGNKGAYIALKVKITNTQSNEVIFPTTAQTTGKNEGWIAVPIGTTANDASWEPGKKYIYKLDFSDGGGYIDPTEPVDPVEPVFGAKISFTVKVEDWDTAQEITFE